MKVYDYLDGVKALMLEQEHFLYTKELDKICISDGQLYENGVKMSYVFDKNRLKQKLFNRETHSFQDSFNAMIFDSKNIVGLEIVKESGIKNVQIGCFFGDRFCWYGIFNFENFKLYLSKYRDKQGHYNPDPKERFASALRDFYTRGSGLEDFIKENHKNKNKIWFIDKTNELYKFLGLEND